MNRLYAPTVSSDEAWKWMMTIAEVDDDNSGKLILPGDKYSTDECRVQLRW
jgi:hypothetical protein